MTLAAPTPLEETAFDGQSVSAESLGRGNTFVSNRATPASGSENPAALMSSLSPSMYSTVLLSESSELPDPQIHDADPLYGKTLRYISAGAARGVVFFEPLGRDEDMDRSIMEPLSGIRDLSFSANAIGFAAADKWSKGTFGMSIAYLWSSLATSTTFDGSEPVTQLDTGNGVRLNLGAHFQSGPAMLGLTAQNLPGFVWWKHFSRDTLPVKLRAGGTWRIRPGVLFSAEGERRYYREGSHPVDFAYLGIESWASEYTVFRAGVFGDDLDDSETRHWTAGTTLKMRNGYNLSVAMERFELFQKKVVRWLLSVQLPFTPA